MLNNQLLETIGFIGAGKMAEAIISGALQAGVLSRERVVASEPDSTRHQYMGDTYGIELLENNEAVAQQADVVILAVKPQVLQRVATGLNGSLRGQLVISIAAGVSLKQLNDWLGKIPVVRTVPNTPCLVGEGVTALAGNSLVSDAQMEVARKIFQAVGPTHILTENLMDAVTGLSGSGPAYVYLIIEALSDGGVKAGLPRDLATQLAARTVLGGAKMVLETGKHPGELKDAVTSPGGTTIAAVHQLEKAGIRAALMEAVIVAQQRARELSGEN